MATMGSYFGRTIEACRDELIGDLKCASLRITIPGEPTVDISLLEADTALLAVAQSIAPGTTFDPATAAIVLTAATHSGSFEIPMNLTEKRFSEADTLLVALGEAVVLQDPVGGGPNLRVAEVYLGAVADGNLLLKEPSSPPPARVLIGATITLVTPMPPPPK